MSFTFHSNIIDWSNILRNFLIKYMKMDILVCVLYYFCLSSFHILIEKKRSKDGEWKSERDVVTYWMKNKNYTVVLLSLTKAEKNKWKSFNRWNLYATQMKRPELFSCFQFSFYVYLCRKSSLKIISKKEKIIPISSLE